MDGFLLIDKQPDWTSFDVCAKVRKMLRIKKVGHTGTLDPFATGLLIVAVGKCTKLIPFLEKARKTYVTKIVFGKDSDTLDPESEVRNVDLPEKVPSQLELETILKSKFTGKIQQTPPQFSAIKIKGKKACDLARKGEKVDIKPRETEVFSVKILKYEFPEIKIEMEVAAGFYVRSFARDLSEAIGTKGICTELRRTKIEKISVEDAEYLEMITGTIDPKYIITHISHREIPLGRIQDFIAGRAFKFPGVEKEKILVLCGGKTVGIGEIVCGNLQPRMVL